VVSQLEPPSYYMLAIFDLIEGLAAAEFVVTDSIVRRGFAKA